MKKKIYLYPKVFPCENPYISDLEKALETTFIIANKEPTGKGVLNLFSYLFNADVFYFNWIESLTSKRFGKFQVLFFVFFTALGKTLGKKTVWTLHNQYSHDKEKSLWVDFMFRFMFRFSDVIITHSMEGIEFAKNRYPRHAAKVKYYLHPLKEFIDTQQPAVLKYDFLIWGTIWPYKGVVEFLEFIKGSCKKDSPKVLIVGKCINEKMKETLDRYISSDIVHVDEFLSIEEIAHLARASRFILFTYRPESILSSGSLMDSIRMGSIIIGPSAGAFNDLAGEPFIKTYENYDQILTISETSSDDLEQASYVMRDFCKENSWDVFGERLSEYLLKQLFNKELN